MQRAVLLALLACCCAAPGRSQPRPEPVPFVAGAVEAFNSRTMSLEVRAADGKLYLVDARQAKFSAEVGGSIRAAEFIDLRPGAVVSITGRAPRRQVVEATAIRINRLPARAGSEDPFVPPARAALSPPPAPDPQRRSRRPAEIEGTIARATGSTDRRITVRVGDVEYTLDVPRDTIVVVDGRERSVHDLKRGQRVRVTGRWEGDRLVPERIASGETAPNGS